MSRIAGIDVGGTFTDLVVVDDATSEVKHRQGADDGRTTRPSACSPRSMPPASIRRRSTRSSTARRRRPTRCSSARSRAVGLITTKGFRDVLELGRRTRPTPYGLKGRFVPLVERDLRLEVDERMDAEGRVLVPLDEAQVEAATRQLIALGCRERRHPLPAQLHQPGARGARRRDRALPLAEPLRHRGPHDRRRVPRVRARHDGGRQRRDPAGAAPLHRAAADRARERGASRASCS